MDKKIKKQTKLEKIVEKYNLTNAELDMDNIENVEAAK